MLKRASATCQSCGSEFTPKREWQRFCSPVCQDKTKKRRQRRASNAGTRPTQVSRPKIAGTPAHSAPVCASRPIVANNPTPTQAKPEAVESYGWGKPGNPPLLGDDYQLEYYEDGYPKLPACLVRRALKARAA